MNQIIIGLFINLGDIGNVTYLWFFTCFNNMNKLKELYHKILTTEPQINVTINTEGSCVVEVHIKNEVTNIKLSLKNPSDRLLIMDPIAEPKFFCHNKYAGNRSASVVGKSAEFLFTLKSGTRYSCTVDFGDEMGLSFTSSDYDWNNKTLKHTYNEEGLN